jgi:hypothetical protein
MKRTDSAVFTEEPNDEPILSQLSIEAVEEKANPIILPGSFDPVFTSAEAVERTLHDTAPEPVYKENEDADQIQEPSLESVEQLHPILEEEEVKEAAPECTTLSKTPLSKSVTFDSENEILQEPENIIVADSPLPKALLEATQGSLDSPVKLSTSLSEPLLTETPSHLNRESHTVHVSDTTTHCLEPKLDLIDNNMCLSTLACPPTQGKNGITLKPRLS